MSFSNYSQCQIPCCYTGGFISAGAAQGELPARQEKVPWRRTVTRNSLVWWLQTAPANLDIRYNLSSQVLDVISRLTSCAALLSPRGPSLALRAIHLVPRLLRAASMCSRTLSDTANRSRHGSTLCSPTVEKILCRSLIVSALQISPCPLREKG